MATETKTFGVRVLLTVTTGRPLTQSKGPRDNGIGDLYEILGWMTRDQPFTHQLPRFVGECGPWLLRWFPELAEAGDAKWLSRLDGLVEPGQDADDAIDLWLSEMQAAIPAIRTSYDVPQIPQDDHDRINAYDELVAERGTDEGIVLVNLSEEEP